MTWSTDARWLTPSASERSGKSGSNEWFMFRNRMTVPDTASCRLRITADSKYWFYANGHLVVREGGLKRGPVPDGTYFDEVELGPYLRAGVNTVAVLVWYFGRHGYSHRDSGMPGLLVDGNGVGLASWRTRRHPAFFDAGYLGAAHRLSENSIGFDARYDVPEWVLPGFNDTQWAVAESVHAPGEGPWGALEQRETGQWMWSDLKEYVLVEARPSGTGDGSTHYHCRLPHNAQFVPVLTVNARGGVRIDISTAHQTNLLGPVYITNDGLQTYECIGWMNGEEVIYKVPAHDVRIESFRYRETSYPAAFAGAFSCGEPLLATLWDKARRTLLVTMRDTFMDCPCRERGQWPGDMVVQIGQVPYCLSQEANRLVRKGLRETLRWQQADGVIYGPVPEGNSRKELPAQMLAVVSRYGIWNYYLGLPQNLWVGKIAGPH